MIVALRRAVGSYVERRPVRWRQVLALGWAALIWWLSSRTPGGGTPGYLVVFVYNAAHVFLFGGLAALIHLAGRALEPGASVRAVALASVWGVVDEVHQHFVPGRHASVLDVGTDIAGAVLFVSIVAALRTEGLRWPPATIPFAACAALVTVSVGTFA